MIIFTYWPKDENLLVITDPRYKTSLEKMKENFLMFNITHGYNIIDDRRISLNIETEREVKSGIYLWVHFVDDEGIETLDKGFYYIYELKKQTNKKNKNVYTLYLERDNFYDIELYNIRGEVESTSLKQFTYDSENITKHIHDFNTKIVKPYVNKYEIGGKRFEKNNDKAWIIENNEIKYGKITESTLNDNIIRKPIYTPRFQNFNKDYFKKYVVKGNEDTNNLIDMVLSRYMNEEEITNLYKVENLTWKPTHNRLHFKSYNKHLRKQLIIISYYVDVDVRLCENYNVSVGEYNDEENILSYFNTQLDLLTLNESPSDAGRFTLRNIHTPGLEGNLEDYVSSMNVNTSTKIYDYKERNDFKTVIDYKIDFKYNPILHLNNSFVNYTISNSLVSHPIINEWCVGKKISLNYEWVIKYNKTKSVISYDQDTKRVVEVNDDGVIIVNKSNQYLNENKNRIKVERDSQIFNSVLSGISSGFNILGGYFNLGVGSKLNPIFTSGKEYAITTLSYAQQTQASIYNNAFQQSASGIVGLIQSFSNPIIEEFKRKSLIEDLKNQHIFRGGVVDNEEEFGLNWYIVEESISETQKQFYNNYFNRFGWVVNAYLNGISEEELREEYDYIKLSNLEEIPGLSINANNYLKQLFKEGIYYLKNPEDKYQIDFDKPWSE